MSAGTSAVATAPAGPAGVGARVRALRPRRLAGGLTLALPPAVWLVLGWQRRWITDDGLIAARTVRQILAGNGPVFNPGERVETNTSALWTWLLAAIAWVTRIDVYRVIELTGLLLAPAGLLFALLGARALHRRTSPGRPFVPLGAAIVVALPPFWDFVTSGLETSLIFFWLGLCWWLLTGVPDGGGKRVYVTAFVAGLGWLVRPDMLIVTVCVLVALAVIRRPHWRTSLGLAAVAGVLPIAYEIFRMGYYGLLVPNTALVKEAAGSDLRQGFIYVGNFAGPYLLWIPVAAVLLLVPALMPWRRLGLADRSAIVAMLASGLLMTAYVIRVGGDFMHARMLLPPTFTLLLPVMDVPFPASARRTVRAAVAGGLAVVGVWAVVCGLQFRMAQTPGLVGAHGIANERAFWVETTRDLHPTTPAPYIRLAAGTTDPARALRVLVGATPSAGDPLLRYVLDPKGIYVTTSLNRRGVPLVLTGYTLGTLGAIVPLNDIAVDFHALAYPYGSHMEAIPGARIGHAKGVRTPWFVADYGASADAPGVDPAQVEAARRALGCGDMALLGRATRSALTWGGFWSNVAHSYTLTEFRVPNDPVQAESQLCGTP